MKPEELRIAIAEACGWTDIYRGALNNAGLFAPYGLLGILPSDQTPDNDIQHYPLPDYLNDLNAMHEAEKVLTANQGVEYTRCLYAIIDATLNKHPELDEALGLLDPVEVSWFLLRATAAQRAEAFRRTLGL